MAGSTRTLHRKTQRKKKPAARVQQAASARQNNSRQGLSPAAQNTGPAFGLGTIQRKVTVGEPGDRYEREADAVAEHVAAGKKAPQISSLPAGGLGGTAQKQSAAPEEEQAQTKLIQRQEKEEEPVQEKMIQRQKEEEEPAQTKLVQRQEKKEEPVQEKRIQRQKEEEEPAQTKLVQRQEKEEEPVQEKTIQRQKEEEEPAQTKLIQRQEAEEEQAQTKLIQRQEKEEEPVQEKMIQRQKEEEEPAQTKFVQRQETTPEEETVQTKADSPSASIAHTASQAIASKGPGSPLTPSTRQQLESGIGADLSHVRVHETGSDREKTREMNARAFAHGNDIWLGPGESQRDVQLMAHETTHVVQQAGGIRQMAQRKPGKKSGDKVENKILTSSAGKVNENDKTMEIPEIGVPPFKVPFTKESFTLPKKVAGQKRKTDQVGKWEEDVNASNTIESAIKKQFSGTSNIKIGGNRFYPFALKTAKKAYVLGTLETVKKAAIRPYWNADARFRSFHVDHKKEIQLGGADDPKNMWLLQANTNMSSGGIIAAELQKKITELGTRAKTSGLWKRNKDYKTIRSKYAITILKTVKGKKAKAEPGSTWELDDVKKGKPIQALRPLKKKDELEAAGIGNTDAFVLFTRESGGDAIQIPWKSKKKSFGNIGRNFKVTGIDEKATQITGTAFGTIRKKKKNHTIKPDQQLTFAITRFADGVNMGYVTHSSVVREVRKLQADPFSPISIENAELNPADGIVARGKIKASLPYFNQFAIDIAIIGNDVVISKTFDTGDFQLPGPIQITGSNLTLFGGTSGIGVRGDAFFDVKGLGSGHLSGTGSAQGGGASSFNLEGELDLDAALFKPPSKVKMKYASGNFSGGADLHLDAAKVKGINSGRLKVTIDGENWEATGEVQPKVPGVESGTLTAKFSQKSGFEIGGKLKLKQFPGIKSGAELTASIHSKDDRYVVKAGGTIPLDIPGVSASIKANYDDGLFDAKATLGIKKGLIDGSLTVGVTNMSPGEEGGAPAGGETENLIIYGSGSATITFTPWLKGTLGIKLRPDGQIEVVGEVGLPNTLDVFPKKKIEKKLFSLGVSFPILGFTVAGTGVGIFARIGGNLTAMASLGPGQLRNVKAKVFYNPSDESATRVDGTASFVVPAEAGLRVGINGSIGASAIVTASGGIELGGTLALTGEFAANAKVNWTPSTGVNFKADVSLIVEPKLKVDITIFGRVEAPLVGTLWEERKKLKEYSFGSGLRTGVIASVAVVNNQFKTPSLDDITFIKPKIDLGALAKRILKQVAGGGGGQRKALDGRPTDTDASVVAARAIRNKKSGSPLKSEIRRTLESAIGADFADVRVHDDGDAREAAHALNARAFTSGTDIWLGPGESQDDLELMAHEATHVVQQGGAEQTGEKGKESGGVPAPVSPQSVQTAAKKTPKKSGKKGATKTAKKPAKTTTGGSTGGGYTVDETNKKIIFDTLPIPKFKAEHEKYNSKSSFTRPKNYKNTNDPEKNYGAWKTETKGTGGNVAESYLTDRLKQHMGGTQKASSFTITPDATYVFITDLPRMGSGNAYAIGTLQDIIDYFTAPNWDSEGKGRDFQIDHVVDRQLGGEDKVSNMQLLKGFINKHAGIHIAKAIEAKVELYLKGTGIKKPKDSSIKQVLKDYELTFKSVIPGKQLPNVDITRDAWSLTQIKEAAHFKVSKSKLDKLIRVGDLSSLGGKDHTLIFPEKTGFVPKKFDNKERVLASEKKWLWPWSITDKVLEGPPDALRISKLKIELPHQPKTKKGNRKSPLRFGTKGKDNPDIVERDDITVNPFVGAAAAGWIDRLGIIDIANRLKIKSFCPVRFSSLEITPDSGVVGRAQILPTIPLIRDVGIDLELRDGQFWLSKEFQADEFKFPGPISVPNSSLKVSLGTGSLLIGGQVDFEVDKLGQGYLKGSKGTSEGFQLEGGFDFDSKLFDPARITAKYANDKFSAAGELGIKPGKVKGIKSAKITANVDGDKWEASGTVQPEIPGVKQGELSLKYDPKNGFEIGGRLEFSNEVPRLKRGHVNAVVKKRGEDYSVEAAGEAELDIPGLRDARISAHYKDGAFNAEGTLGYEKGRLAGSLTVGMTNQAVDESGQPAGEPTDNLTVYGQGSLTLTIAPWLQGTAGVRLRPDGEIEVMGKIGLPDKLEVFPEKKLEKELLSVGIDIPIVGVAVAGQRIGIFATISGSLTASAGIGPGELRQLELEVFYNPSREEDTSVTGRAQFVIPAHAGLRLAIRGGLGAGIPVVSAQAGLEVGGSIGIEGEAAAAATVNWTPARGIELDANVSLTASPKFKFDISGYVLVEADLLLTTIELYEQRWQFASFEYGSDMTFGLKLPVKYREGQPFDISLSDVEFIKPDIDVKSLLAGLIENIA